MRKILIILLLFIVGCSNVDIEGGKVKHKNVELITEDGIRLAGDLYDGGDRGLILLHMFTVTKRSWESFARKLQERGYTVLAIDFRGHGQSELNYRDFSEEDFNNMILDVRAAKKFLGKEQNIVMGASIGANIALKFANEVDGVVALSPSFNYKGIKTKDDAMKINKPVLIVVSEEDRQSIGDSKGLNMLIPGSKLQIYSGKGHGTNMIDDESEQLIFRWLEDDF